MSAWRGHAGGAYLQCKRVDASAQEEVRYKMLVGARGSQNK